MKTFTGLLSLAIIGGSLIAGLPAKADTAYHAVYHTPIIASDSFSIMDKYQNNVLTSAEYSNARDTVPFAIVDADGKGFITRAEYYAYYNRAGDTIPNGAVLSSVTPAAGGDDNVLAVGSDSAIDPHCRCN